MSEANSKKVKLLMPCLLILFILANLMVQAFVTVSPAIASEFQISASTVSMIITMSTIVLGVCSVVYGALSDYIPVRKLLAFGLGMFLLGTILGLVFQKTFIMIVIARAVQTVGQAAISSLYLVIASRYFEGREKIKYFAYFTASFQVAQALGVLAGGMIATYINWKMLFVISLLSIIFIPAIIMFAPVEEKREKQKIDLLGMLLFSIMIVLMTLLLNNFTLTLFATEMITMILFLLYISKHKGAFITPTFFKQNQKYTKAICIVFMMFLSQFVFSFLYTFIVSALYGNALDLVSYILLPGYIAAAVIGALSGRIITKIGRYNTVTVGMLLITSGLLLTGLFMESGKLMLSMTGILFFMGFNTIYSPMIDTVTSSLPKSEVGRGIGLNDLTINISSSIGVAIGGRLMVTKVLGNLQVLPLSKNVNAYGNIMLIFALIAFISLLLFRKSMKAYYTMERVL